MTMHQMLHHALPGYISPHPGFGEHLKADELELLLRRWPLKISGVGGHRMGAFLQYEAVLQRPIFYMTFLRDPIRRYMSSINWKKNIMSQAWTPESYVEEPYYHNFQCFRIAGERSFEKARDILLEKYSFVGLMEEFNRSLLLLQNEWPGKKLDVRYVKDNVKDYGTNEITWESLSPETQERYRACNQEDIKLVEFVRQELWPRYLNRFPGNLAEKEQVFLAQLKSYKVSPLLYLKQKGTNFLLGKVWQPLLFGREQPPI